MAQGCRLSPTIDMKNQPLSFIDDNNKFIYKKKSLSLFLIKI